MLASDLGSAERTAVHCGTRGPNHRTGKRAARHAQLGTGHEHQRRESGWQGRAQMTYPLAYSLRNASRLILQEIRTLAIGKRGVEALASTRVCAKHHRDHKLARQRD